MKKFLLLFFSLILLVSCNGINRESKEVKESKELLEDVIQRANAQLPVQLDFMTTWVSCEFDGQDIIYTYEVDESYSLVSNLDKSILRSTLEEALCSNPQAEDLIEHLKKVKGTIIHKYIGNNTGDTLVIDMNI